MEEDFAKSGYFWKCLLTLHKVTGRFVSSVLWEELNGYMCDLFSQHSVQNGITKAIL